VQQGAGAAAARSATPALIQRQEAAPVAPPVADAAALPTPEELTTRIALCIGIWETARGQNAPAPRESSLHTVAGVRASMATTEQATMPYAITAFRRHPALRDLATPPLTVAELNDAEARVLAVSALLTLVGNASANGQTPDDFIAASAAPIAATGLDSDDVRTMFSAVTLRATLDQALTDMNTAEQAARDQAVVDGKSTKEQAAAAKTARQTALTTAIGAIPAADRLGLGEGSLKTYINKPRTWGENRAGWQRKAVNAMPGDVGARIEAVAVSDNGTALAIPVTRTRVDAELARTPVPSLEDIVRNVAQRNNPNEPAYGTHVWETYQRLYP
jgi:hypothetical protein